MCAVLLVRTQVLLTLLVDLPCQLSGLLEDQLLFVHATLLWLFGPCLYFVFLVRQALVSAATLARAPLPVVLHRLS
jgi:hypothetical protein